MTALWTFYSLPEPPLRAFLESLRNAVESSDLQTWRNLTIRLDADQPPDGLAYHQPPSTGGRPVTKTEYYAGYPDLSHDELPQWSSPSLSALLREVTLRTAVGQLVSRDSKPGMRFTLLDGEDWFDEEELEYEILLANIFRAGTSLEKPFAYLGGGDYASVAWLSPPAIKKLLAAEENGGLLERLGKELGDKGDPLGPDLSDLHSLMKKADKEGLSLYYFEPGT